MTFEEFADEQRKNITDLPALETGNLATVVASVATETTLRILKAYHNQRDALSDQQDHQ